MINIKPLIRYRDFRLLFLGQTVSFIGSMVSYVAIPYQVYQLTHSTLKVGILGAVQFLPVVVFGLLGGSIADRVDRRRLLIVADLVMCLSAVALAANSMLHVPNISIIFFFTFFMQAANAYHRPAMIAMTQKMVAPEDFSSVGALGSLRYSVASILGPAIGGLLISEFGISTAYIFDISSYLISLLTVLFISRSYRADPREVQTGVFADIRDGLKFAFKNQALLGTYFIDLTAMAFAFPVALFPALAPHWGGSRMLGWLYSAMAVGGLLTSVFSGKADRLFSRGKVITLAAASWGVAIIGFGYSHELIYALGFLVLAGSANMWSALYRGIIWNETIPNQIRGRLAGIEMVSFMSGPLLGNFRAGLLASWAGFQMSIVSGGLVCTVAVVVCALSLPGFWHYTFKEATRTHARS